MASTDVIGPSDPGSTDQVNGRKSPLIHTPQWPPAGRFHQTIGWPCHVSAVFLGAFGGGGRLGSGSALAMAVPSPRAAPIRPVAAMVARVALLPNMNVHLGA